MPPSAIERIRLDKAAVDEGSALAARIPTIGWPMTAWAFPHQFG